VELVRAGRDSGDFVRYQARSHSRIYQLCNESAPRSLDFRRIRARRNDHIEFSMHVPPVSGAELGRVECST
jgi:hypothetical protein